VTKEPAKITRVTFDIRGQDSKGRFVLTMTAPISVLSALAAGDTSPELPKQIVYSVKYEGPQ
jgi:hypothetical protein